MTPDEIKQKLAGLKNIKPESKPHYIRIETNGNYLTLLLPYKQGLSVIAGLENAERYVESWGETPKLTQIEGEITFSAMSGNEYEMIQKAAILGIPLEDIKNALKK